MVTKGDGVKMGKKAISLYREQAEELSEENRALRACEARAAENFNATLLQVSTSLLPTADEATVRAAATEVGAPGLLEALEGLHQERINAKATADQLEQDSRYQKRDELIHPTEGRYPKQIAQAKALIAQTKESLEQFDDEQYQWLLSRGYGSREAEGGFTRFWRAVTLMSYREGKADAAVCEKFSKESFAEVVEYQESIERKKQEQERALEESVNAHNDVVQLIEKHAELRNFDEDFQNVSLQRMRENLARHLSKVDLAWVHDRIRPAGKVPLAKCQALLAKLRYFQQIRGYIKNEVDDRSNRERSIGSVVQKWSVKPGARLQGNKRKWLQDVPQMKHKGTKKRVKWLKTMRHNIDEYDDYEYYSYYMESDDLDFLPYDAFGYGAEERMPYEGFSKEVIPDIETHRTAQGQEKADYTQLKECIKGSEEHPKDWNAGAEATSSDPSQPEGEGASPSGISAGDVAMVAGAAAATAVAIDVLSEEAAGEADIS